MSPRGRLYSAALIALSFAIPATAHADTNVDAAVATLNNLNLTPLTAMPSGRTTYRTIDDYNNEMQALATAHPNLVSFHTAPNQTHQGRAVNYIEITNSVANTGDGKPVMFIMGAHHGNEKPSAEDSLEFAYDVINTAATNPQVAALLDKVRIIDMPIVNVDGFVNNRRQNCYLTPAQVTAGTLCTANSNIGVDINRNYPVGWNSISSGGTAPASEPEPRNVMSIMGTHQVTLMITNHTYEHTILYPPLEFAAGDSPDDHSVLGQAMADQTGDSFRSLCSACDYETTGETIDYTYYTSRTMSYTIEEENASGGNTRCGTYSPTDYVNCVTGDYAGTGTQFAGKGVRKAFWLGLTYAATKSAHGVISGTAMPGSTLKISKDFNVYTHALASNNNSPLAYPIHLESSLTVPASGKFSWDVDPSVRPQSAYESDGIHMGPNGFLPESFTITCSAPGGTLLSTSKVLVDKGDVANVSLCTQGSAGGTVAATLSLTMGSAATFSPFIAGVAKSYTASTTANVISSAGDATLTVSDPSTTATGHLVNGSFSLPSPLTAGGSALPATLKTYSAPISNDVVPITFTQAIGANDALRTGTYAKTLTFTLSTTNP